MDPRLLYQLAQVLEFGSLSRAADRLNVTQPTLSRNIRIIEDAVGAPVVRRGRYGVTATDIGARLAERGRAIGAEMAYADDAVAHWRAGLTGDLRVGVGPMLALSVMPAFFAGALAADWPYAMRVTTATAARLVDRLNSDALDTVLAPSQLNLHQERLEQTVVMTDEMAIFAGARSPLLRERGVISADQLAGAKWISTGARAGIHGSQDEIFSQLGIDAPMLRVDFTGDVAMALELLRTTDVLVALPRRLAGLARDLGGARPLDVGRTLAARDIALWVTKANKDRPEIIHFDKAIRAHFAGLIDAASPDGRAAEGHAPGS